MAWYPVNGGRLHFMMGTRNMQILWRGTAGVVLLVCLFGTLGTSYPDRGTSHTSRDWAFHHLADAHCVIEGIVSGVGFKRLSRNEYAGSGDGKVAFRVVELANVEVIRGYGLPREVIWDAFLGPVKRWIGERVILCCYWKMDVGMFLVCEQCMFHHLKDRWVDTRSGVGFPPEWRTSFVTSEIDSLVDAVSLSSLTRRSDLIVVGRIASAKDTMITIGPERYRADDATLTVMRVLKGNRRLKSLSFVGEMHSPWVRAGETWIAFLRRDGDTYRPIGGANGLLQFTREKVFYDRVVRCPVSRNVLMERVRREVQMNNVSRRDNVEQSTLDEVLPPLRR